MIPTREQFEEHGGKDFEDMKTFANGEVAWLHRFMFTAAILYGWRDYGYLDRWCFETMADARRALADWDGTGDPEGWHRHPDTGRRRDKATGKEWVNP